MSRNLYEAHRQWSSRSADERYWNLKELANTLQIERTACNEKKVPIKSLVAVPEGEDIHLKGPRGGQVELTNWSFGQLCVKAEAPSAYLRELPSTIAAQCLNHGLRRIDESAEATVLLRSQENKDDLRSCRAITSTDYSRIWDTDVVKSILPALDHGWITPPARPAVDDPRARKATKNDILPNQGSFNLSVREGDMIAPAGIYRGDRDMFLFLVNPERIIDDGNNGGGLMRGVFITNSEVGKASFRVMTFLLETVCGNHICWGASELSELRMVHRGTANRRFGHEMALKLRKYNDAGCVTEERMIIAAKRHELGVDRDQVIESIFGWKQLQMTKKDAEGAFAMAEKWEKTAGAPPTTTWGFVHGLTRYSQLSPYADERLRLDRVGGKLLEKALSLAT
jgi:hypothetical protein